MWAGGGRYHILIGLSLTYIRPAFPHKRLRLLKEHRRFYNLLLSTGQPIRYSNPPLLSGAPQNQQIIMRMLMGSGGPAVIHSGCPFLANPAPQWTSDLLRQTWLMRSWRDEVLPDWEGEWVLQGVTQFHRKSSCSVWAEPLERLSTEVCQNESLNSNPFIFLIGSLNVCIPSNILHTSANTNHWSPKRSGNICRNNEFIGDWFHLQMEMCIGSSRIVSVSQRGRIKNLRLERGDAFTAFLPLDSHTAGILPSGEICR